MCIRLNNAEEILRHYFENHGNVAECVRKLRIDFGRREALSALYIRYLVKKLKETCIVIDKSKRKKPAAVAECVRVASSTSTHLRLQQLNISEISLRRVLHKDLGMTSYKV